MHDGLKEDAAEILKSAIEAVEPSVAVKRALTRDKNTLQVGNRSYDLDKYQKIYVIAFGKASVPMAKALEEILYDLPYQGVAITKYGSKSQLESIEVYEAAHPVPDENSLKVGQMVKEILSKAGKNDLVIFLISGGGSSLLALPRKDVSFKDFVKLHEALLLCGATIKEINTVRKHLSTLKGGGLAKMAYPADSISLVLSDVVGDHLDIVASGPTVPDSSTFEDFNDIVERYHITLLPSISRLLEDGLNGLVEETLKTGDPVFDICYNKLIGTNCIALDAAAKKASEMGYNTLLLTSYITGESKEIAKVFSALGRNELLHGRPMSRPACILAGGEATVTLKNVGKGGRCQEMALSFAIEAEDLENLLFLAAGTDGIDGPTDAAGAFADGDSVEKASMLGMDAREMLDVHDSYDFFNSIGDLHKIGQTGTNVMDIYILLVE
ncbi:glycerate kinase [uncultured Methanomethylovorans sp.]|uniref:glycerate kinase type-2 family protein n=1 Tax=uncultured Methanomethylovorans sp. TaxID=183759 RepID=UPI002AA7A5C4|nr:glycerate kinase [uncultured Methanomethylovorans sp.]